MLGNRYNYGRLLEGWNRILCGHRWTRWVKAHWLILRVGSIFLEISHISIGGTYRHLRYLLFPELLEWNACNVWQPVQLWQALVGMKQPLVRPEVDSVSELARLGDEVGGVDRNRQLLWTYNHNIDTSFENYLRSSIIDFQFWKALTVLSRDQGPIYAGFTLTVLDFFTFQLQAFWTCRKVPTYQNLSYLLTIRWPWNKLHSVLTTAIVCKALYCVHGGVWGLESKWEVQPW